METIAKDAEIKGQTVVPNQDASDILSNKYTVIYVSEEELMRRLLGRNQIDAQRPIEEVFEAVNSIFSKFKLGSEES
ncbi:hypothetical protein L1049_002186 [Liquidambar formosana]|uniref:Uncharacterized protein n=1 Tax=Liquidambar formosana TaxID=63359 RepID=A0AAP0NGN4_LIQFO